MVNFVSFLNIFFSIATVGVNVLSVVLIVAFFSRTLRHTSFIQFIIRKSLVIAFITSFLATIGSLAYSDIVGYTPCKMCWLQRIFMYSQALLFGIALIQKDLGIRLYGLVLSIIGAIIALYHYITQLGWNPLNFECGAIGYSASCAKTFVLQFGYITIPVMAFSAFALMALVLGLSLRENK